MKFINITSMNHKRYSHDPVKALRVAFKQSVCTTVLVWDNGKLVQLCLFIELDEATDQIPNSSFQHCSNESLFCVLRNQIASTHNRPPSQLLFVLLWQLWNNIFPYVYFIPGFKVGE